MAELKNKVAIVTGAAGGMGRAHCLALARQGVDIVAVDIVETCRHESLQQPSGGKAGGLAQLTDEIRALGRRLINVFCNVSKAEDVQRMVTATIDEFGRIDILVNNAGVITSAAFAELPEEEWDLLMNVNLKGAYLCCQNVLPHMRQQQSGKIVNIGSVLGREGSANFVHYCCSKAAIHMLTDALSKEVGEYNINVNCVAPGTVWGTPMADWAMRTLGGGEDNRQLYQEIVKKAYTLGREQTADDITNAMLFLVSEKSRNITGYTIYVDGGHKGAL